MQIAWSSVGVQELCTSRDGLTRAASGHAEDVRLLLTLVSAADELAQLETLRCVSVTIDQTTVLLRLGGVEVEGSLRRTSHSKPNGSIAQLDTRMGLLIQEIRVAGQPLLRAAG